MEVNASRLVSRCRRLGLVLAMGILWLQLGALPAGASVLGDVPRVTATAYGDLPKGSSITIEVVENTSLNQWIKELMTQSLQANGFVVNDNGDYSLKFHTTLFTNNDGRVPVEIYGSSDRGFGNTFGVGIKLPIGERAGLANESHITLDASVAPRGQAPIWVGKSVAATRHRQLVNIDPQLVNALMAKVGQTVGERQY